MKSFLMIGILVSSFAGVLAAEDTSHARYVIWKFDDLRTGPKGNRVPGCTRLVDWATAQHMPISLGIIANSLPTATAEDKAWLLQHAAEKGGVVEFWNHGWDHHKTAVEGQRPTFEFQGPDEQHQGATLIQAQAAMVAATGLTFRSFGAPFNATDEATIGALDRVPELTVWMYGMVKDQSRTILRPSIPLEIKTGVISEEAFLKAYTNPQAPYLLLQGHPPYWDEASFAAFTHIAARLTKDGWTSITPQGYAAVLHRH